MNRRSLQLDEPQSVSRRAAVAGVAVSGLYLLAAMVVTRFPGEPVAELPGVALAHSVSMAIVGFVTAVLLYSQASRASNRGYLLLAGTFVCVVILVLALPLGFPGALLTGSDGAPLRILGGLQSSISLFYAWHLILYAGLPVAALSIQRVSLQPRRPVTALTIILSIVVAAVLALSVVVWTLAIPTALPALIGDGAITGLAGGLDQLLLALAVAGLIVIVVGTRERSAISRWITGVAVLSVGEAIVNLGVERYSIGWYFTRTFGLLAMSSLLMALVWELARLDRTAFTIASIDTLTHARRRDSFEKELDLQLARCLANGQTLALLWIDVDDFKSVNDQFGHRAGDEVLRVMTSRALAQIRGTDVIARMGGDEFAIAIPAPEPHAADTVAMRIVTQLREPMAFEGQLIHSSCSVGLAFAPADASTVADLCHKADVAMYEAKATGGNRFVSYRRGLEVRARESAELRTALNVALEQGDFVPFAQPIVDVVSARLVGLEILARWQRGPELVDAVSFIQVAEAAHLVVPIGQRVRAVAIGLLPAVLEAHPELEFVSFNVSAHELTHPTALTALGSPPWSDMADHIALEIIDGPALDASGPAVPVLDRLRSAGYRIALDDFGGGFSSITRLEALHPSLIKSDRCLLNRSQAPGPPPSAILAWALAVCESMGSRLVVTGVESANDIEVVAALGGVLGQGYRYGAPEPLDRWLPAADPGLSRPSPLGYVEDRPSCRYDS